MRKLLFLLVALLLSGCGSGATPVYTPKPSATPTEDVRYLPNAPEDVARAMHDFFSSRVRFPTYETNPTRVSVASLVSTGETGEMTISVDGQEIIADYLVVYDYLYLGYAVPTVKVIYGFQQGDKYFYLSNNEFWSGEPYSRQQAQEDVSKRFPRGAVLDVIFYNDGFVSRDSRINWDKCSNMFKKLRADAAIFCDIGAELEKIQSVSTFTQYTALNFREDWAVLGLIGRLSMDIQLP